MNIAHRGFKALYPENTLLAFDKAVRAGADGIELDVHPSRDGEVVIAHDPSLQRVFGDKGGKRRVVDVDWFGDMETLTTVQPPHEHMPRLIDVLKRFRDDPAYAGRWLLIDVKPDNPVSIIASIRDALAQVDPDISGAWGHRVVLGIWHTPLLPACKEHLPMLAITV